MCSVNVYGVIVCLYTRAAGMMVAKYSHVWKCPMMKGLMNHPLSRAAGLVVRGHLQRFHGDLL